MLDRMRRHFDDSADTAFKHAYQNITVVIGREGQGQPITATVTDIETDSSTPPTFTVTLNQSAPSSVTISSITFEYDYFNTMGFNSSTNDDEDGGDYGAAIDHKNFVITSGRDIDLLATDDINIEAGSTLDLTLRKEGNGRSDGIDINLTSDIGNGKEWSFRFNGALKFPDETRQFSAYPGEHGQLNVNAYKGFKAIYGRMYNDEPTISKVLIYQATIKFGCLVHC
jgi:hypothetical protein